MTTAQAEAKQCRTLTVDELMAALQSAAVVKVGREYGTAKLIAEAMDTSDGQVRNLLNGRAGDLRWSTVVRAVEALSTLEGKRLRLRLLVEESP